MNRQVPLIPPFARVPPRTGIDLFLNRAAAISVILIGVVVVTVALEQSDVLLAPVSLAVVIGLMFGPVAGRMERAGIWPTLSAAIIVVLFLALIVFGILVFATPLSEWSERLPLIWTRLQLALREWKEPLQAIGSIQQELRGVSGAESDVSVTIEDGGETVRDIALFAPVLLAQIVMFLASLYFFVATREQIRTFVLSLCISRRLRWRAAHIFKDIEINVSRYLLSITLINIGLGVATGIMTALLGLPSPILWGALAAVLNYFVFIGPTIMVVLLAGAGLAVFVETQSVILPPLAFLALNLLEAQFVTPYMVGRSLTLNPFVVFLAVAFWLWLWGPIGGFVAVPFVLIAQAVILNILPRTG